jgi:hypothetical protein
MTEHAVHDKCLLSTEMEAGADGQPIKMEHLNNFFLKLIRLCLLCSVNQEVPVKNFDFSHFQFTN